MDEQKKPSRVLKWLLIIGLVIILNLFFNFAIKLVYEPPLYEAFCPRAQVTIQPTSQTECVSKGGAWQDNGYVAPQKPTKPDMYSDNLIPAGYCDLNFTCSKNFNAAQSLYNRNVFTALIILGILSLIAGFFLTASSAVSLGLSLGGVLSLVIGSIRYWSDMHDYLRVIILGAALIILIVFGVKKLRD